MQLQLKQLSCCLCYPENEMVLANKQLYRLVWVQENPDYVGFIRLIVNRHVKEMSDLLLGEVSQIMDTLIELEKIILEVLQPDKINLASLGNQVPHVHWHIIPRFMGDKHFPNPIWGEITNVDYYVDKHKRAKEQQLLGLIKAKFN